MEIFDDAVCSPRSSPFFWAVQEGLVRDTDLAAAVFKFADSLPGAEVGRAVQRIDLAAGLLVSEVEVSVFPGLSGTVTTTSTITGMCTGERPSRA